MRIPRTSLLLAAFVGVVGALAACAQEEYPAWLWAAQHPTSPPATPPALDVDAGERAATVCVQARAESLPARLVAMSANAQSGGSVVLVSDLFERFTEVCGSCHGPSVDPPGSGGFQIAVATDFGTKMTAGVLEHVTMSACPQGAMTLGDMSSPTDPMPPCNSAAGNFPTFASRPATDPVAQFATLVGQWIAAGSPKVFTPPSASTGDAGGGADGSTGTSSFTMTPADGNAMTDIGNCVPSTGLVGIQDQMATDLDAKFAAMKAQPGGTPQQAIGLPEHLSDTDLFTFDSSLLAQYGVVAYAPGYPLWSDGAGKLRHVRVPRGQSIHFNKTTQQFEIPPNTRFYKTFMKQIVDTDGSYRYRKIETRLIVSRPDQNNPDGTAAAQTALFGTYKWNDTETDAALIETPLNDGEPFADTILTYNTDEQLAAAILAGQPADPESALIEGNAARHYAIPSSQRCIQCHMGSPSQAFVLGFTPLQINRRPLNVGGTFEPAGPDELTQLQRFIDAGIISGIDSPSDVLLLEQSQGTRTPRNDYELRAQAYMLGNCAHCHNPRGFPTIQNPVLQGVLDFLPSANGGIFQFPLEKYSPRFGRGVTGSTLIPYITPSLVDLPKYDPSSGNPTGDWFVGTSASFVDFAPWRSMIFRNVESSFAYTDDFALFPHMPMNTPGYDPRAKQFLGDWMVSIPAIRKRPELQEYAYQADSTTTLGPAPTDTSPQPYVEVLPTNPGFAAAARAAQTRLSIFHTGSSDTVNQEAIAQYGAAPMPFSVYQDPGQTNDILDPDVVADPICHPIPAGVPFFNHTPLAEHPHWVTTDLTSPPYMTWPPRQPNWPDVLVHGKVPPPPNACPGLSGQLAAYADEQHAVALLPGITLDKAFRDFATTPMPFGLWQTQKGCNFASQKTVGDYTGPAHAHWMDVAQSPAAAPVYAQIPGQAVFKMICINCHGPKADSNGRLAQNLATMTGGLARVADFRDGLFGPPGAPEEMSNRHAAFSVLPSDASAQWTQATDDDRAARYMAWMGLGGTSVNIPVAILQIVAVTKVLDQIRTIPATSLSANMLSQAKALCASLLGPNGDTHPGGVPFGIGDGHGYLDANASGLNTSLISVNGDAELWTRLCTFNNPSPIHVLRFPSGDPDATTPTVLPTISQGSLAIASDSMGAMVASRDYPQGQPVGNERGGTDPTLCTSPGDCPNVCTHWGEAGCTPPNLWPWCVDATDASAKQTAWIAANQPPVCPEAVATASKQCLTDPTRPDCFETISMSNASNDSANAWAVRGAINAGMSVFLYVESIENSSPPPDYNQCSLLQ